MINDQTIITTIDFLRHGECEGGEIYRGTTDVCLSQRGWEQMSVSLDSLLENNKPPWQRIISSPLKRCQHFSRDFAEHWNLPLYVEKEFRELDFGDWEGRPVKQVWHEDAKAVQDFYRDPEHHSPPNGEAMTDFRKRLLSAWQKLLKNHSGEHLLLVQHGASIRMILLEVLQMPMSAITRIEIPYAGLSRVRVYIDGDVHRPVLVNHNSLAG